LLNGNGTGDRKLITVDLYTVLWPCGQLTSEQASNATIVVQFHNTCYIFIFIHHNGSKKHNNSKKK